ncbi:hypothetical protein ABW20_dc0109875 [Dactylellina cionopaga]|nr:hypothetical protein ABW20_dc0109875 [Dactylellina cionopaga]
MPPNLELGIIDKLPPADEKNLVKKFDFSPDITSSFYIKQESFRQPSKIEVVGNVIVHSSEKVSGISTQFHVTASDNSLLKNIEIKADKNGLTFRVDPVSSAKQTVNATVYIVINKNYHLEDMQLSTIELPIWLADTFTSKITKASLSTISSPVTSYGKASKSNGLDIDNLTVTSTSGDIRGEYPLQSVLDIQTTSGNIEVDAHCGDLRDIVASLKTKTVSGQTKIKFENQLNSRQLNSKHESVSGDIEAVYPKDWQGTLDLVTMSGSIDAKGAGTNIAKNQGSFIGGTTKVMKGDGKSTGLVNTVSGNINVLVGDK